MESEKRRLIQIRCIQILVHGLRDIPVTRHIDPVNTTFSPGILQYGINQPVGITSTLHVHQIHSRLESEQIPLLVPDRIQNLHQEINISLFPPHETLVIHIIEHGSFPIPRTGHTLPDIRGNPVGRGFSTSGSIDRLLESGTRNTLRKALEQTLKKHPENQNNPTTNN